VGDGEEVVPTIGFPVPNHELRESVSTEGPQCGLIETGEVERCSQGLEEDGGGAARGGRWIALFRCLVQTLASQLELTTSARVNVVRGGAEAIGINNICKSKCCSWRG
jgi:hypothetical protein